MDIYNFDRNFLITYRVDKENSEMLDEYYLGVYPPLMTPNTEHNKEVLDNRLKKQYLETKDRYLASQKDILRTNICSVMINSYVIIRWLLKLGNPTPKIINYFCLTFLTVSAIIIKKISNKIKRFKLTEYCIDHIDEVNEIIKLEENRELLSESFNNEYDINPTFSLNSTHEYLTSDLNKIKKMVKRKENV